jgi:hypothetical protein
MDTEKAATDRRQLIAEFLDSRRPKNEHEHAAAVEIVRLNLVIEELEKTTREASERMRERCEEAINDILNGGLYHGPYPEQVCDIIAGVLESCKEKIRTLELEEGEDE